MTSAPSTTRSRRDNLHEIIFEAETPVGEGLDVIPLIAMFLSIGGVCVERVTQSQARLGPLFRSAVLGRGPVSACHCPGLTLLSRVYRLGPPKYQNLSIIND